MARQTMSRLSAHDRQGTIATSPRTAVVKTIGRTPAGLGNKIVVRRDTDLEVLEGDVAEKRQHAEEVCDEEDELDATEVEVQVDQHQADIDTIDAALAELRRASEITSTSISSFPESMYDLDSTLTIPMHQPYSPPGIRPQFRRPSSVRRLQMTSPIPFDRSPRRSVLRHHSKSRPTTPRSMHKGSPRVRRPIEDEVEDDQGREFPLVLLHATLLPVDLRWSNEVMHELLPQPTLDKIELLRSKVSETILQRGVLIQHPKDEYDLLEERLLQALELRKERVTKCGHFRARDSVSSSASTASSVRDSDSGVGSDIETCATCSQQLKLARLGAVGEKTWTVKIFAANGLLGSSAWAAAWPDMERVDVEILPYIDSAMRKALDARQEELDVADRMTQEEQEARLMALVDERVRLMQEDLLLRSSVHDTSRPQTAVPHAEDYASFETSATDADTSKPPTDLPRVYRPSEIPLSVLLKNYIYLLAQDRRNVVIFALSVMALWLSLCSRSVDATRVTGLSGPVELFDASTPLVDTLALANGSVEVSALMEDGSGVLMQGVNITAVDDADAASPSAEGDVLHVAGDGPRQSDVVAAETAIQENEQIEEVAE